jgi:hypothetical protein
MNDLGFGIVPRAVSASRNRPNEALLAVSETGKPKRAEWIERGRYPYRRYALYEHQISLLEQHAMQMNSLLRKNVIVLTRDTLRGSSCYATLFGGTLFNSRKQVSHDPLFVRTNQTLNFSSQKTTEEGISLRREDYRHFVLCFVTKNNNECIECHHIFYSYIKGSFVNEME